MWSSVSLAGKPRILMVDASGDVAGWESEFCDRLYSAMSRRNISVKGSGPARVHRPEELPMHLEPRDGFNCILLFARGPGQQAAPRTDMRSYWDWLNSCDGLGPKLLATCAWEEYDPSLSHEILESAETFAPLALAQQSPLTPHEATLFYLKFFTELELHSSDDVTARMVWFSCSKARELLRKRRLPGKIGLRC